MIAEDERPAEAFGLGAIARLMHELGELVVRHRILRDAEGAQSYLAHGTLAVGGETIRVDSLPIRNGPPSTRTMFSSRPLVARGARPTSAGRFRSARDAAWWGAQQGGISVGGGLLGRNEANLGARAQLRHRAEISAVLVLQRQNTLDIGAHFLEARWTGGRLRA